MIKFSTQNYEDKKAENLSTIKELRCRILSDGAMNFFRNKS